MINGIDNYLQFGSVKSAWITLYILSIFWGALYMIKPFFDSSSDIKDEEIGNRKSNGGYLSHVVNSYNAIRDNSLMLLVSLALNTFGTASTKAMSVISWIFFVVTIIYAIAVLFVENKVIRAIFNLVFFVLMLIMSSLAFKHGW